MTATKQRNLTMLAINWKEARGKTNIQKAKEAFMNETQIEHITKSHLQGYIYGLMEASKL